MFAPAQPNFVPVINWAHPLAKGLIGAWVAQPGVAKVVDLLGQNTATGSGLVATVGRTGRALKANATQAKSTVAVKSNLKPTAAASVFWHGWYEGAGTP